MLYVYATSIHILFKEISWKVTMLFSTTLFRKMYIVHLKSKDNSLSKVHWTLTVLRLVKWIYWYKIVYLYMNSRHLTSRVCLVKIILYLKQNEIEIQYTVKSLYVAVATISKFIFIIWKNIDRLCVEVETIIGKVSKEPFQWSLNYLSIICSDKVTGFWNFFQHLKS